MEEFKEFYEELRRFNIEKYKKYLEILSKPSLYTFQNPRIQLFSLPPDVIQQIFFQKKSPFILSKLYQTCKYFFKKCQILIIGPNVQCSDADVYTAEKFGTEHNFNKNVLFWFYEDFGLLDTCLSVRQRIYWCTLKNLDLVSANIYLAEFEHLILGSKIEKFECRRANIFYTNGSLVPINVILQKLPFCSHLVYNCEKECYSRKALLGMNHLQISKPFSILSFDIFSPAYNFDPSLLWKFVKKNTTPDSFCYISLMFLIHPNYKKFEADLRNALETVFPGWNGKEPKIVILAKTN